MTRSEIRVLLVHDQAMVRAGLKMLIESWPGTQVVGEVGTPAEAVKAIENEQPDILLLDLDLTGDLGGLELLQKLNPAGLPDSSSCTLPPSHPAAQPAHGHRSPPYPSTR